MIRNSDTRVRKLTLNRNGRKYRQNLLVWFGMPRAETKRLRFYNEFVDAYDALIEKQLDDYIRGDDDRRELSSALLDHMSSQIQDGSMGMTNTFNGDFTPQAIHEMANEVRQATEAAEMAGFPGKVKDEFPMLQTTALVYAEKHYLPEVEDTNKAVVKIDTGVEDGN